MVDVPGVPEDLPEEVKRALSEPGVELPVDPTKPVVNADQLKDDLTYKVGEKTGFGRVKAEERQDPLVELAEPLDKSGRIYFFPGLVHGYCKVDSTLTERYRAATGAALDSEIHRLGHPLVTVPSVRGFEKTQLAHTLQSVPEQDAEAFFSFLREQLLVDRPKKVVWQLDVAELPTMDPYLVDKKDEPPYEVVIHLLCPRTYRGSYKARKRKGMFVGTPEIQFVRLHNPELEKLTKEVLGAP